MLVLYLLLSLATMFTVTAGVTIVAAGMLGNLLSVEIGIPTLSGIVMLLCFVVLYGGKYATLEKIIKIIAGLLVVTTLVAFFLAIFSVEAPKVKLVNLDLLFDNKSFIFIIALMGWMPSALDLASWNSIWTAEKMKIDKKLSFDNHIWDFNFGYLVTTLLAFCFLTMGAILLYNKDIVLSDNSVAFANQLTSMYTSTIGDWVFVIIALSAFSAMFSTTLTVLDGYPRIIEETVNLLSGRRIKLYRPTMLIVMAIGWMVIVYFAHSLSTLIDLATAISFVVAPIIAIINFKVIMGKQVSDEFKPKPWLRYLSYAGITFLLAFAIIYIVTRF